MRIAAPTILFVVSKVVVHCRWRMHLQSEDKPANPVFPGASAATVRAAVMMLASAR